MSEWRKVPVQDPDGEGGWQLIPPDELINEMESLPVLWAPDQLATEICNALNVYRKLDHFDIQFTPARKKRANSPRRASK